VLVQLHVAYNCPEALPRRRLEVLGTRGQLTAARTMGQSPGRHAGADRRAAGLSRRLVVPDAEASPFARQMAAFARWIATGEGATSTSRGICIPCACSTAPTGVPPHAPDPPMPLTPWACTHCGFWQKHFAPTGCLVCEDTRNDLPADGWEFWPEERVAAHLTGHWRALDRDMVAFTTTPGFGLNGTGWLLLHPDGNVAFEAAPYYTPPMLDEIRRLGGIRFLAASHCHGYGALWQLQDVFQPEVLAIQKDDLRMTKAMRVTWPYDEALELRPGQRLLHVGGHYEGQALLHDAHRRILFCGDAFKVDQSPEGGEPRHLHPQGLPQIHPA
jgi:hypothetical protein